jgi:predicted ATPase
MHTLGVTVLSTVLLLYTTQWLVNVNMYPLLSLIEQGIDGETLQILAEEGSVGQLRECGLTKIKDQLKLKRLIKHSTCTAATMPPAASSNTNHSVAQDRKLEKKEIASLPPEEKKAYLIK